MSWDAPNMLVAFLASAVGLAYTVYGKKQTRMNFMLSGIGLMAYSYFTPTLTLNIVVGAALTALPLTLWR